MGYSTVNGYTGRRRLRESVAGTSFTEIRGFGFLTGPDQPVKLQTVPWDVHSRTIGGFLQDSWDIVDVVTLNLGLRYDVQVLYNDAGEVALALPNQWSPRIGAIYDFTRQGKSKLFVSFARYYQSVPLDAAQRALSGESQITSVVAGGAACNPLDKSQLNTACEDDANRLPIGGPEDPQQKWIQIGGAKTAIDPDIEPPSTDSIIVGGEYEVIPRGRVGARYEKRYIHRAIEDMSRDEANTYFSVTPVSASRRIFPRQSATTTPPRFTSKKIGGSSGCYRPVTPWASCAATTSACTGRRICSWIQTSIRRST